MSTDQDEIARLREKVESQGRTIRSAFFTLRHISAELAAHPDASTLPVIRLSFVMDALARHVGRAPARSEGGGQTALPDAPAAAVDRD